MLVSPAFATGGVCGCLRRVVAGLLGEGLHYTGWRWRGALAVGFEGSVAGDSGRALLGQFEVELGEQEFLNFVRRGVALEDQGVSVGGGELYVEHLDGGELLKDAARCQTGGFLAELVP